MSGTSPNGPVWDTTGAVEAHNDVNGSFESPRTRTGDEPYSERTFIDLFAGAGGLSLGLMSSGWRGVLAVEKNTTAFETLSHNLIDGTHGFTYEWPEWFPRKPCTVGRAAGTYRQHLLQLRGKVTMIVGGPPCQGFSLAGKRNKKVSRNLLFKAYMRIVEAVQPLFILLENVHGITMEFDKRTRGEKKVGRPPEPYSRRIVRALDKAGYEVQSGLLRAADYGVPQLRPRYFLIQKSAYFMAQRLREAWSGPGAVMAGPAEADESYFGGREKNKHSSKKQRLGRGTVGKTAVAGIRNRATNQVRAQVVPGTDAETLQGFVTEHVAEGATVYTDENRAYQGLPNHETVNHSVSEFVRDQAHTNGLESFWASLKRGYHGTFHHISPKHLHRYVNEFAGRHNLRPQDTERMMQEVYAGMIGKRLMYRELIAD